MMNNLLRINWCDDIISAGISTILAIGISWFFFHRSNRMAFINDILHPIAKSEITTGGDRKIMLRLIHEKKNLYTFRYAKKDEKEAIFELENCLRRFENRTFQEVFADSIINYFFKKYEIDSTHETWVDEMNMYEISSNFPNYFSLEKSIKDFSGNFSDSEEDDNVTNQVEETLKMFYVYEIQGKINIDEMEIFKGTTIKEILHSSGEYKQYIVDENALNDSYNDVVKLDYS